MADAKRCDVCGAYFDQAETGFEVIRHKGRVTYVDRWYLRDVCSSGCLAKLALDEQHAEAAGARWKVAR